ncbi:MAG: choice-of-anchor L domain-containing protein [Armatimonadota bacterium]
MKQHLASRSILTLAGVIMGLLSLTPARAIVVSTNANVYDLVNALLSGGGITVLSASLSYQHDGSGTVLSTGTFTNASGTYGIGDGIVLSAGNVADYSDGPNTDAGMTTGFGVPATGPQEALLDPITGGTFDHFDVTQLDITFLTSTGDVSFYVVFGSEEYPEFVGSSFVDGFGLYLDGVNIASVGGLPVNINHPDFASIPGTELDGILAPGGNPLLSFGVTGLDTSVPHSLTFILADTSDNALDTTVYLSSLSGGSPVIPEPGTWLLMLSGLTPVALRLRRRS